MSDNLKTIVGIGHTYEERLNDAGITTFKQLAEASIEKIAEATQASPSMIKYWQTEAESKQ